jgi:uracil-DNA glycosylase
MLDVHTARLVTDSHAAWWSLAGLESLTGEEPYNWLAPPPAPTPAPMARAEKGTVALPAPGSPTVRVEPIVPALTPITLAPLALPDDWDDFQHWLAHDNAVPGTRWHQQRVLPAGAAGARLMILSLTPEMDDQAEGKLHSGRAGQLLDAMLRAIGHDRSQCYSASLALTRPPGGRIDSGDMAALTPLLWHHLRLAGPKKLLIFGTDLAQLIAGTDPSAARGQLLFINHDGVKVEAVAVQHPLLLLDRPARKAAAWESLKRLAQG